MYKSLDKCVWQCGLRSTVRVSCARCVCVEHNVLFMHIDNNHCAVEIGSSDIVECFYRSLLLLLLLWICSRAKPCFVRGFVCSRPLLRAPGACKSVPGARPRCASAPRRMRALRARWRPGARTTGSGAEQHYGFLASNGYPKELKPTTTTLTHCVFG